MECQWLLKYCRVHVNHENPFIIIIVIIKKKLLLSLFLLVTLPVPYQISELYFKGTGLLLTDTDFEPNRLFIVAMANVSAEIG